MSLCGTLGAIEPAGLLGGRVRYAQPAVGLRAAVDPVLLAACIPARSGERVLEGGTGAGAALLCLAARVPGLAGLGLDREPGLIGLARANALANGWPDLCFAVADLRASPLGGAWSGRVDHAFANPPYHRAGGTASPDAAREAAKRAEQGVLRWWADALVRPLRHRGTATFILAPWMLEEALAALRAAGAPAEAVFPIWPKAGRPARFAIVRGRKNGRSPLSIGPGLILHTESGAYRPEAEAVLRGGEALRLDAG